ncbi:MAG: hypothetical protein LBG45_10810 [Dysgonamonadaceae bacterium]|jgi:hypothetical protein|nr:hypothetical protein [Dysgonamonadaceae bacterium]
MIHYFNPGHEMAVLNASKYYQPPRRVAKMQEDLALLPAWYASPGDDVFTGQNLQSETLKNNSVELWGVSPQSIHYFETLDKQYGLQLRIPEWKEAYRFLGSRFAAQKALAALMEAIPEIDKTILPQFCSCLAGIEKIINPTLPFLIKSPYSSSGRGLLWIPAGKLAQPERQIIGGMLKKQSLVSVEKALDKRLDFSMHFEISPAKETRFVGYSVFRTNAKGAYESSLLAGRETLEKQITDLINKDLLRKTKEILTGILQEMYAPHYAGNIGVDMMAYACENQFRLHPCVEINMRKSMGYLAIRLFENHISPTSQGSFFVEYHKSSSMLNEKHTVLQKQYPLQTENDRICSGYLNLCPVTDTANYLAYIVVKDTPPDD